MRAIACSAAALLVVSVLACSDRSRQDTSNRIESAADEAGAEVREGAKDVEKAADKAGEEVREGAKDVEQAAEKTAEDARDYSYDQREEFRRDVRERLDNMDEEISVLADDVGKSTDQARKDAIAGIRKARRAVDRSAERLATATASNFEEVKRDVNASLDLVHRKIRALQPDAKPMGGTGGPN